MTTNYANATYQEVIDLHTEAGTTSIVGLHTPRGSKPYDMLRGFFEQFAKYKYRGASFALVPAARLPADPLQVSLTEAGEPTIDPRDMLNPIMFKGCHGNDMGTIINTLYTQSTGEGVLENNYYTRTGTSGSDLTTIPGRENALKAVDKLYYSALTDNTWLKAHPQSGLRKNGLRPLVYSVATNKPFQNSENSILNPSSTLGNLSVPANDGAMGVDNSGVDATTAVQSRNLEVGYSPTTIALDGSSATPRFGFSGTGFFTPRLQRLGWLDTMAYVQSATLASQTAQVITNGDSDIFTNEAMKRAPSRLPLVYMGMLMLPPAYKTEQYFRLVINHQFEFKTFRGISGGDSDDTGLNAYYNLN